jgi:ssDNA-binding Zn-finger/Zn-ribbon topoisomerase 1
MSRENVIRAGDYEETDVQCEKCQWRGRGRDAILIDFYGISKLQELHCPKCDRVVGMVKRDDGRIGGTARP